MSSRYKTLCRYVKGGDELSKLCYIYARKSVDTGRGESIENQIALCRNYMTSSLSDEDIRFIIYTDKGFSGKSTNRPQFKKMYEDIRLCRPDFVVCYRLDRISRNVGDFAGFSEYLERCGTAFVSVNEKFDTSSPMGKAMMYITSVFAQLERETIAERVRDNMHMLAKTGRWLGGTPPMGYTAVKDCSVIMEGKAQSASRLEAVPGELEIVRRMFEKYLETKSISAVSKFLIAEHITAKSGKDFSLPGIKEILQNPVYCIADGNSLDYFRSCGSDVCFDEGCFDGETGLISYNKRDYSKGNSPRQTRDRWIIAAGRHRGIISGSDWAAVQSYIDSGRPTGKAPAKMHNDYALLSGRIFCEKCGGRMFAKMHSGARDGNGKFSYICSKKLRGGTGHCDCLNLSGGLTDDAVCRLLLKYADSSFHMDEAIQRLGNEVISNSSDAKRLRCAIAECDRKAERLLSAVSSGNAGEALLSHISLEMEKLDCQKKRLNEKLDELERSSLEDDMLPGEPAAALSSFTGCYESMTVYEKRELIGILAERMTWDGERLCVFVRSG